MINIFADDKVTDILKDVAALITSFYAIFMKFFSLNTKKDIKEIKESLKSFEEKLKSLEDKIHDAREGGISILERISKLELTQTEVKRVARKTLSK